MHRLIVRTWPVVLVGLLVLGIQLAPNHIHVLLRYERDAIIAGELWRVFSGHVVHAGWNHVAMNLAALAVIATVLPLDRPLSAVMLLLWLMSTVSFGLLMVDIDLVWYVGLSGVLHGLLVAGAAAEWRRQRLFAVLLFCGVAIKLGWEQLLGTADTAAVIGAPVVTSAHLYGAAAGIVAVSARLCFGRTAGRRIAAARCP